MSVQSVYTLINKQNSNLAFKLLSFEDNSYFDHLQRNNYYSLIWVTEGSGKVKADCAEYPFDKDTLFAFAPYQPFMFSSEQVKGMALHFHPDFFCIHKHHADVACNGVLFNNIYQPPLVQINNETAATFKMVLAQMKTEMQQPALAQYELLVSYLKIFLITASRLKAEQRSDINSTDEGAKEPFVLQNLKEAIETNYKEKRSVADYAMMLNISAKALAKITKAHFNRTITNLISERVVIEAKRELYLTSKPVKQIAFELGFMDEYYFSRFFKNNADISPQYYRETVGFARGES